MIWDVYVDTGKAAFRRIPRDRVMHFQIRFPDKYPVSSPVVFMDFAPPYTRILQVNVHSKTGNVRVPGMKSWTPSDSAIDLVLEFLNLLEHPEFDSADCCEEDILRHLFLDRAKYDANREAFINRLPKSSDVRY